MLNKLSKFLSEHSQITLIVSIMLMIFFSPYYWQAPFANYFNFLFLALILLSAILTMKKSSFEFKKVIRTGGYIILIFTLIAAIIDDATIELVNRILFILFFVLVAVNLLTGIVKSKEVDSKVIFSAVAVYILYGFCGAIMVALIMFFNPAAFSMSTTYSSQFHYFLYFSFITITTTGYGDILPVSPIARSLAILLALFGQLYLTVIIGILIGKYLSRKA